MKQPQRRLLQINHHHAASTRIRKRVDEHSVYNGENGGIGADAKRESENGDGCEAGVLSEHARAETQVLPERFEEWQAAELAIRFAKLRKTAEADVRLAAGFQRRHAMPDVLLGEQVEMRAEFAREFLVIAARRKQASNPRCDHSQ